MEERSACLGKTCTPSHASKRQTHAPSRRGHNASGRHPPGDVARPSASAGGAACPRLAGPGRARPQPPARHERPGAHGAAHPRRLLRWRGSTVVPLVRLVGRRPGRRRARGAARPRARPRAHGASRARVDPLQCRLPAADLRGRRRHRWRPKPVRRLPHRPPRHARGPVPPAGRRVRVCRRTDGDRGCVPRGVGPATSGSGARAGAGRGLPGSARLVDRCGHGVDDRRAGLPGRGRRRPADRSVQPQGVAGPLRGRGSSGPGAVTTPVGGHVRPRPLQAGQRHLRARVRRRRAARRGRRAASHAPLARPGLPDRWRGVPRAAARARRGRRAPGRAAAGGGGGSRAPGRTAGDALGRLRHRTGRRRRVHPSGACGGHGALRSQVRWAQPGPGGDGARPGGGDPGLGWGTVVERSP